MIKNLLDTNNLYRLPWSKNDNPNGWVEVTTYCNMACPGCYRGCDRKDNKQIHKPLEEIKKEILELKRIRNCQTISISGGEPLMHPDILEIVSFVRKNKMDPAIFTNGKLLTKEFLIKLKKAGLNGLVVRVDSLRDIGKTERELNNLRQHYTDLVYSVGGITLVLSCCVDKGNLDQVNDILKWAYGNPEKKDIILFILKREVAFTKKSRLNRKNEVSLENLVNEFSKKFPGLRYGAFLGNELENVGIKWLQSSPVFLGDYRIGYLDEKLFEAVHVLNHLKNKTYLYIPKKDSFKFGLFGAFQFSLFSKNGRMIFWNYLRTKFLHPSLLFKKARANILIIVNPPSLVNGKRDLCDSCPDATLYKGKLVPSCLVEELERLGNFYEEDS